jgi:hypothetical protein
VSTSQWFDTNFIPMKISKPCEVTLVEGRRIKSTILMFYSEDCYISSVRKPIMLIVKYNCVEKLFLYFDKAVPKFNPGRLSEFLSWQLAINEGKRKTIILLQSNSIARGTSICNKSNIVTFVKTN